MYFSLPKQGKKLKIIFCFKYTIILLTQPYCCRGLHKQRRRLSWWVSSTSQSSTSTISSLPVEILTSFTSAPSRTLPPTARCPGLRPWRRWKRRLRQRRETRPLIQSWKKKEKNENRLLSLPSIPTRIYLRHETLPEQLWTSRSSG